MSETSTILPPAAETTSQEPLETLDQVLKRLSHTVEFLPYQPGTQEITNETPTISCLGTMDSRGEYHWTARKGSREPLTPHTILDVHNPSDTVAFTNAQDFSRHDKATLHQLVAQEGRWWTGQYDQLVENKASQAFLLEDGDRRLDLINCSNEELSEAEQASIVKVFNAVSHFTGGKIWDRLSGVLLVGSEDIKGAEETSGSYEKMSSILKLNMAELRKVSDSVGRHYRYFKEGQANGLEIVMAHELGHAMDVASIREIQASGVDMNNYTWFGIGERVPGFSAFNERFGWEHKVMSYMMNETVQTERNVHRMNEAREMEEGENAPTSYALISPGEDFAESFAIASLGGDVTKLPSRYKRLGEAVSIAEGSSAVGPTHVELNPIAFNDLTTRLTQARLKAYLQVKQPA